MKVLSDTVGEFKLTLQKGIYVGCVKKILCSKCSEIAILLPQEFKNRLQAE